MKSRLGYDDSLDAVGVHMVGGLVGALLTGVFASLAVNPAGADGGWAQLGRQGAAAGITLVFSFAATWMILKLVDGLVGFRSPRRRRSRVSTSPNTARPPMRSGSTAGRRSRRSKR